MPFGLVNKTRTAFVAIGAFGIDFVFGYVEEITFNATGVNTANAMDVISPLDVPDSQILIKKFAYANGAALTSSVVKNSVVKDKIFGIISGATFTGLI